MLPSQLPPLPSKSFWEIAAAAVFHVNPSGSAATLVGTCQGEPGNA